MEAYADALLVAIPFFILLMVLEMVYGQLKGFQTYSISDTVASLSSGLVNSIKDSLGLIIVLVSYPYMLEHLEFFHVTNSVLTLLIAFVALDLAGYWNHRLNHKINVFWNLHIIHHSSEEFNLACALRQPISNFFGYLGLFLIPAALFGIPHEIIQVLAPLHLFLQFWYHTKHIGKLGWVEYILVTPSQHRVHHAINNEYLDKNLAPIFSIWDRLFGTFQEELEEVPPVYGVLKPTSSWNPVIINFQHFWQITKDAWRTKSLKDKVRIWFMPTGWRPEDVAQNHPIQITEAPSNQVKYSTSHSALFSWYFVFQMLVSTTFMLIMFAYYRELGFSGALLMGAVIFFGIFSYTSFMDKYDWSPYLEIFRAILGLGILFIFPSFFALQNIGFLATVSLSGYFIFTAGATYFFAFKDPDYSKHTIQPS